MIYDRKLSTSYLIVLHRAVQHTWKASISSLKYIQVVTPSRSPSSAFFTLLQGFASDIVRYVAFFSYFTIQLVQLFLCCFADRPPEGKTISEKVGPAERIENSRAPTLWFFQSCRQDTFPIRGKYYESRRSLRSRSHHHFIFGFLCKKGEYVCSPLYHQRDITTA